ncbi:MAG: SEC-C metal-binding domain-containing protein [Thermodesulfobacteriota bacterium]
MKIGRNDPCPCGSGQKHKKCCLGKQTAPATGQNPGEARLSLQDEVKKLQEAAVARKYSLHTMGVFIFLSTEEGDGWLLEITAMDALQVASAGTALEVEIDEQGDTIEINWSHTFTVKDKKFRTTAYKDRSVRIYPDYPATRIAKAINKIRSMFPKDLLDKVHLQEESATAE